MDDYITEHPQIKRAKRLKFANSEIDGTIKDLIVLAYEARDDAGYNRFRIFVSENGTPAFEFYDGLISTRIETEEEDHHNWISKLWRKNAKA